MVTTGKIKSVMQQVAEVEFFGDAPQLHEVLSLTADDSAVLEVYQSSGLNSFYCLILRGSESLVRGAEVTRTEKPLRIPVGESVLGRVFNVFGEPLDEKGALGKKTASVFEYSSPGLDEVAIPQEIMETGIKAVDFFAPMLQGGKMGLFGGAGLGKTVILTELINNIVIRQGSDDKSAKIGKSSNRKSKQSERYSVFAAVGERSREVQELVENLDRAKALEKTSVIVGQMGENPAVRFQTAYAAVRVAEYMRDNMKSDVLFFMDNMYRFSQAGYELSTLMNAIPSEDGYQPTLPSEISQVQSRLYSNTENTITSIQTVYLRSDDLTDLAVRSQFPYLDAMVVFSRDIYQQGRLPAIDLLASASSALAPEIVGEEHYTTYIAAKKLLEHSISIERLVSMVGLSDLSADDQLTYKRAQLLKNYLTQSFFVTAVQTGRPGTFVPRMSCVHDVAQILEGYLDTTDPEKLLNGGSLAEMKIK